MLTVRRIYLYLVAAISLIGVTWAVIGLARLILSEGIGQGQIIGLASALAIIIVGLPIYLFHWLMAQRLAGQDEAERGALIRRLYYYAIMGAGAAPIISNIYRLVDNGLLALLGGTRPSYYPYDLTSGEHLAALLIWSVVWLYTWRQVQADDQWLVAQAGAGGAVEHQGVRRLYRLALSLAGLVMIGWGAMGLLQTLFNLAGTFPLPTAVANLSAKCLVGGAVWVSQWSLLQRTFFRSEPGEERSVLRKLYLYLAVFVFSTLAISSTALLLARLIELALGGEPSGEPLLSQLSNPLSLIVVGGVFWAYHWRVLQQDARQAPEGPRQAGVRRIYTYLVAALGLLVLATGIGGLLSQLIDLLTTPATIGFAYYREQVALFAAMTIVGLPVWFLPWRPVQGRALMLPDEATGTDAAEERRSTVRKIYLYFFVLVAALGFFGSVGWFVFHVLTALLGADLPDDFSTQVLDALVIALLAAGVWLYHWFAIRQDGRLEQQDQARRLSDISVVVIDGEEGKLGQSILQHLRHDLPGLQLQPIGMTPQATTAMAGQPFSAAVQPIIRQAHYIIGSWHALTAQEVAPAITTSGAVKLVAPLPAHNWVWAGVRQHSPDYYARQAVTGVKQALDGEEIKPGGELDWSTLLIILGGILLFLIISGSLIALIGSLL